MRSPTARANDAERDAADAYRRINLAMTATPIGDLQTSDRTGPVTGGDTVDRTAAAAAQLEHAHQQIADEVVRLTVDLVHLTQPKRGRRWTSRTSRRGDVVPAVTYVRHILGIHRSAVARQAATVRRLDRTAAGWDDAEQALATLNRHVNALRRCAGWTRGLLTQPDADPDTRVCDHPDCQAVLRQEFCPDQCAVDGPCSQWPDLCEVHAHRRARYEADRRAREAAERAAADQHAAQVQADRAAGLRCHGDHRPCDRPLLPTDVADAVRNCSACRAHASRQRENA